MVLPCLIKRNFSVKNYRILKDSGIHPLLSRIWAARGISNVNDTILELSNLASTINLTNARLAARILNNAIENHRKILIVADYDCDGATACAVAFRALSDMGADVNFFVPNRFETGYGLSIAVVEKLIQKKNYKPDLIITVDNGITSVEGVDAANSLGIGVIITDHHLPGDTMPEALAIVNPNQKECKFPSKNLSGVGVIFYLMLELRSEMRRCGKYAVHGGPKLSNLLDLVALGTMADVVKLDFNNRLLVYQGLKRIRNGKLKPGLEALFTIAKRNPNDAICSDLSFLIAPRINAAGRLKDMTLGINCLLTDDFQEAMNIAKELNSINKQRQMIELNMKEQAINTANEIINQSSEKNTLCIHDHRWHQGVIGLIASKLKDRFWKPTIIFASIDNGKIRGSGRSIPDVNLRDILDTISKRHIGLINNFGGHALAAGLTLNKSDHSNFASIFENVVEEILKQKKVLPIVETDGSLEIEYMNVEIASLLKQHIWGSGFNDPLFLDYFFVQNQKLISGKHLKLLLKRENAHFEAICFNRVEIVPNHVKAAYRLEKFDWKGKSKIYLKIEYIESIEKS
ncbi:MAG: single-stranded-DNA-specific exonuclease RecJ [Bordetella sp.]|nr:MAG: single-stranded-DNA-specific exonuclease RecJ [Bordetella sp.]